MALKRAQPRPRDGLGRFERAPRQTASCGQRPTDTGRSSRVSRFVGPLRDSCPGHATYVLLHLQRWGGAKPWVGRHIQGGRHTVAPILLPRAPAAPPQHLARALRDRDERKLAAPLAKRQGNE